MVALFRVGESDVSQSRHAYRWQKGARLVGCVFGHLVLIRISDATAHAGAVSLGLVRVDLAQHIRQLSLDSHRAKSMKAPGLCTGFSGSIVEPPLYHLCRGKLRRE